MHEFSLDYLRCIRCGSKLETDIFCEDDEIIEGMLKCKQCSLLSPIINKIPIIWNDFSDYVSSRIILGGKLYRMATHEKMKKFLKASLLQTSRIDDRTKLEGRWSTIYQNSKNSKFYLIVKNELREIPRSDLVLEYGCSIGIMTNFLADYHDIVFGVDRSYDGILSAKKSDKKNLDYFVADFMSPVFGKRKFDIILALNVLELFEPVTLLKHVSRQIKKGILVISDPYDFERGKDSVKKPLDEKTLRRCLSNLGFLVLDKSKTPSYHPWNLKLSSRSTLNYKVDLIIATKN